ncbi:polymorphic toxin-type HINT domain-containing protein [Kitasatospora sp. NPDC091257]|uniref:polymorphic toxin-type HINT domain-containing protein n=1 Tax=Kitasatospora sp. NPDC091257 TaxID=3364084 RepID=UPI00381CF779
MSRKRSVPRPTRTRMSAIIAGTLVGSLLPALPLAAVAAAAEPYTKPSAVSPEKPVKGSDAKAEGRKADTTVSRTDGKQGALPGAGSATVDVPGEKGKAVKAGKLPVALSSSGAAGKAKVELLGQDAAAKAGINGVLLTVTGADENSGLAVDYSSFAQAAGSGFGSRLKLVRLPECALTTPDLPECRVQTPLPGGNDVAKQTVAADALTTAPAGSMRLQSAPGAMVLAATTGSAGPSGDYRATPLSSASSWSTALNSGAFTWSYDMPLTAMPGGLTPKVGLSYNSGAIDGRTANSNNQASWAGDGFDLSPGFVERSYKACADDGAPKTGTNNPGDLCWGTDNATISFAGHSGELIPVSGDEWRIKNDDATKVVRVRDTGRGNGDNDGEYFRATTTDGTTYYFGYNRLPNWSAGKPETKSVYTVPVYGNNAGEPCNGADFASSWCQQGWRWNLDLVVDAHGNDITYWYTPETNNYGRNLKATDRTSYVRGGRLDHIEYGQQQGDLYSATVKPMGRVDFGTAERCLETGAGVCDPAKIDANRQYWYDTPWDQNCKDGTDCTTQYSPTFFTRTRLTQVLAKTLQADGSYATVDTWDLTHKWGTADFDYQLLLDSIKHTGSSASPSVALPKTTLAYKQMANRLDKVGDGRMPFIKQRLGTVTDEQGGQLDVNYSAAACDWNNLPTPQSNTTRCFPQMYQASDETPVTTEWFNKYVVDAVIATDRTGGAPDMVTHYTYLGDAAWHFDDEDGLTKDKLKTWSQWRGYARTRVETGGVTGMTTQADHWFLRGMDQDRNNPADKNGKRTVTVDDGQGTVLTDDDAWAGYEYRTEQYDKPGGVILGKNVNTPWKQETAKRVRDWGTTTANITGTTVTRTFTSLDKGTGSSWRETRTNNTRDGYGRVTSVENQGDVAVPDDDTCTRTTYADNAGTWILRSATRVEVVAANCATDVNRDTRADGTSAVLSDIRYRFDGQGFGAAPAKGDITLIQTLKSRTGNSATYLDHAVAYDGYGRPLSSTELASSTVYDLSGATNPVTTASPNARTSTTAYTPATGRPTRTVETTPPAKAGDATTTQTTTTDYDLLRGLAVDTIDANNRRTDTLYDALGRTLKVWLPDRSKATGQTPDQEYAYTVADNQIVSVAGKTLNEDGSQQTAYTLYDGLGRFRQGQAPGDNGGRVIADTFYDERGQTALAYSPYYATGAPSGTLRNIDDTAGLETQAATEYDGLGRVVRTTALSGNGVGTPLATTLTEYGGDRVTVTPPTGGTPTTTVFDAVGRAVELRQYKSATPTGAYDSTTYGYDAAGNLSRLTGPAGSVWTWQYDQLGRRTKAVDPDSGTTTSTYNDRGDLTATTDGGGKTVATAYDNLSRPIETRDGSATGPLLTSRAWDPAGNKGHLSSSTRYSTVGGTTYQYKTTYSLFDTLARPTRTTVTIPSVPGQEALAGSYISGTIYRLDGQAKSIAYPAVGNLAAESVAFTYDALHRPTAAEGLTKYLTNQTYSLTGKPLQSTLSNGTAGKDVYITNGYEWGTQRLASSRTDQYGVTGATRAAAYTYDQAGNVTSVTDTSRSGTDRQCFRYDSLARLTEAYTPSTGGCTAPSGTQLGGPAPYWTSWTYNTNGTRATETRHDTTGNTGQDATTTYTYPAATAARPHSLSSTSTVTGTVGAPLVESYDYDTAGNTTGRHLKSPSGNQAGDQALTWDSEGRVGRLAATVQTTNGSTTATTNQTTDYLYDAVGNRLLGHTLDTAQPAAESWTLYLDRVELKLVKGAAKATATRYYPLGSATAVRTDDNRLTFQVNDHHGTAEIGVDATTGAVDQRRSLPFGGSRGTNPATWAGTRGFLGGTAEPTGLTHLGARDYDPATGRFISVDPVLAGTDPQSLAGYTYSNNNPLTLSDPSGLRPDGTCGGTAQCRTPEGQLVQDYWMPVNGGDWVVETVKSVKSVLPGGVQITTGKTDFNKLIQQTNKNLKILQKQRHRFGEDPDSDAHDYVAAALNACHMIKECQKSPIYNELWDQLKNWQFENIAMFGPGEIGVGAGALGKGLAKFNKSAKPKPAAAAAEKPAPGNQIAMSCDSFPAGVAVRMADGTTKPIEQLKVGDLVLATDPETGKTAAREVDATMVTPDDADFTTLLLADGRGEVTATDHHPFWSVNRDAWVNAGDLTADDTVRSSDGTVVALAGIRHFHLVQPAHNLTVRDLHTYYVLAGNTPVLVHNSGPNCVTTNSSQVAATPRGRAPEYHGGTINQDQAMDLAERWLGAGYREEGVGRYVSSDGSRIVRYGKHETTSKSHHIHFEAVENGRVVENTSVEIRP